jgi:hypothetical protein
VTEPCAGVSNGMLPACARSGLRRSAWCLVCCATPEAGSAIDGGDGDVVIDRYFYCRRDMRFAHVTVESEDLLIEVADGFKITYQSITITGKAKAE